MSLSPAASVKTNMAYLFKKKFSRIFYIPRFVSVSNIGQFAKLQILKKDLLGRRLLELNLESVVINDFDA